MFNSRTASIWALKLKTVQVNTFPLLCIYIIIGKGNYVLGYILLYAVMNSFSSSLLVKCLVRFS